eukprot:CAMPEP_0117435280 /NCGR_PEP_ID=MMETSP0759-20121206/398_1 /TAXON_ID=63605 /ORGANISM="Percolomonas cosmopolitus, Strain WS" /LENGTH=423 /DNA_ID=CAMNT_0005226819 /DNA_START=217 /DNA_END=1489 /DNA_ORIENTATION=+
MTITGEEAHQMKTYLSVESQKEWTSLLKSSRLMMRQKQHPVSLQHKQLVQNLLWEFPDKARDIPAMIDELQLQHNVDLPRETLHQIIRTLISHHHRIQVTPAEREMIGLHVQTSPEKDVPAHVVTLRTKVNIPPRILYELVWNECIKKHRGAHITKEHRQVIRNEVEQSKHLWDNLSELSDLLQQKLPQEIPRGVLSKLVLTECNKQARSFLSEEQKAFINQQIELHGKVGEVEALHNQLLAKITHENVPKRVIQVHLDSMHKLRASRASRRTINAQQREIMKNHIRQSANKHDKSLLFAEMREKFNAVPASALLAVIRNCLASLAKEGLSKDDRDSIKAHIEHSDHPFDLPLVCDELQKKMPEIPRQALFDLIGTHTKSLRRKALRNSAAPEEAHVAVAHSRDSFGNHKEDESEKTELSNIS